MIPEEKDPAEIRNSESGNYSHIKGWGIDADPSNDPTYPYKTRTNEEQLGVSWQRPVQQQPEIEVLHSNERPDLTAVFGTAPPPSGISGMLRRYAFTYSESDYRHWLPLVLADRIGVYEGIAADLGRGYIPNILAERGLKAAWKHNRKALVKKVAVKALITAAAVGVLIVRKRRKKTA